MFGVQKRTKECLCGFVGVRAHQARAHAVKEVVEHLRLLRSLWGRAGGNTVVVWARVDVWEGV